MKKLFNHRLSACILALSIFVIVAVAHADWITINGQKVWLGLLKVTGNAEVAGDGSFTGSLSVTGNITGLTRVVHKTDATYTVGTDSATDYLGTYFINSDNDVIAFTLPTAVSGRCACFENEQGVTAAITVTPGAGDYLVKTGVRKTAATAYSSAGAAGDKLCVLAIGADDWQITTEVGTWAE